MEDKVQHLPSFLEALSCIVEELDEVGTAPVCSISISLSLFVFTVCKPAKFSKSCKLIGSEWAVFFYNLACETSKRLNFCDSFIPKFLSFKFVLLYWQGKSGFYYWDKIVCPLHDTGPMSIVSNEIALLTTQVAHGWAVQGHRCDCYLEFKNFLCARPWNIYCLVSPLWKVILVRYDKQKTPVLISVLATFLLRAYISLCKCKWGVG